MSFFNKSAFLTALGLSLSAPMAMAQQAPVAAPAKTVDAAQFVGDFAAQLMGIMNASIPLDEKARELVPLLNQNVDIQNIGKYCIGKYWRTATPQQQEAYINLFAQYLLQSVTAQVGNYQNVSIHVVGQTKTAAGTRVMTSIVRPGQPAVGLGVLVTGTPPKVADLYAEGVSMRLSKRQDFISFLQHHGDNLQELITALQSQLTQNASAK